MCTVIHGYILILNFFHLIWKIYNSIGRNLILKYCPRIIFYFKNNPPKGLGLWCLTISFIGGGKQEYPEINHWPVASHWETLSHNVVSSTTRLIGVRTHNVSADCIGSCISNYHTSTTMMTPNLLLKVWLKKYYQQYYFFSWQLQQQW